MDPKQIKMDPKWAPTKWDPKWDPNGPKQIKMVPQWDPNGVPEIGPMTWAQVIPNEENDQTRIMDGAQSEPGTGLGLV